MKKNTFAMMLLCLIVGCAVESQNPGNRAGSIDERSESTDNAQLNASAALVVTAGSLTWHLDPNSGESCSDLYPGTGCDNQHPGDRCPASPNGKLCSIEGDRCNRVLGQRITEYECSSPVTCQPSTQCQQDPATQDPNCQICRRDNCDGTMSLWHTC